MLTLSNIKYTEQEYAREGHYIQLKGKIDQEHITVVNI